MPRAAAAKETVNLVLIHGEDDFASGQSARKLYQVWTEELGGFDHEVIEGSANNSNEALRVIGRLRESLQTLPFFGSGKAVWLRGCNFLGDERTASSEAVTTALADLASELKEFSFDTVRLLITALKVDKRKTFYKTIDKIGSVEEFGGFSEREWASEAEAWARKGIAARGKTISDEALAELVSRVGPHSRLLDNEIEKLSVYAGEKAEIGFEDVSAVCSRNKTSKAFALGDALGDRDLPRLLKRLDEELWEVKLDPKKSEIGVLYGLISKVRSMLLLKELLNESWVKPNTDYAGFKAQLERIPQEKMPEDRRFNPLAINAYILYKALPQVKRYSQAELIRAMELLFECNRKLVSSGLDESLVLQQALVEIVGPRQTRAAG
jgi:DNA polymerase-3 subunit delta